MAEKPQKSEDRAGVIATKRGVPIYEKNPSIPGPNEITRVRKLDLGQRSVLLMDEGTGEIRPGGAAIWEQEEVDKHRFVKFFLDGIKQTAGLSKAGLQVFEVVYHGVRDNPGNDKIELNYFAAKRFFQQASKGEVELTERTYQRGLRELLDREFLFRSPSDGVFFLNVRYMFNGDRLHFVKSYYLKGSASAAQGTLPLDDLPALPPPGRQP